MALCTTDPVETPPNTTATRSKSSALSPRLQQNVTRFPSTLRSFSLLRQKPSSSSLVKTDSQGGLLGPKKKTSFPFTRRRSTDQFLPPAKTNPLREFAGMKKISTVVGPEKKDVFTAPSFRLAPYGDAWYSDVLVMFTNALRQETKTLFFILYCLYERPEEKLETGDIQSFYLWYEDYHQFFETIIDGLQNVYLPWAECLVDLPASKPKSYFDQESAALKRTVKKTSDYSKVFLEWAPKKAARQLRSVFDKFAPRFLSYISSLEDSTSMIVECQYTITDCMNVSKHMVAFIFEKPNYRKNFVLLLRWLGNRHETAALWRRKHMDIRSFLSFGAWKRPGAQENCVAYFKLKCRTIYDENLKGTLI